MPAASSFELSCAQQSHRGQLRPAGDQPRELAAGGARHRGAFDRDLQRHLVLPLHRSRRVPAHAASARRWSAARATSQVAARGAAGRRSCCARRMTAMPTASASSTTAR